MMNTLLHCPAADKHPPPAWPAEQSFCTQLSFALERPAAGAATAQPMPNGGDASNTNAADLSAAERIAGTYTVSYNAASGLLALSGSLNVDGATYFIDDQLTIDQEASFDACFSATTAASDGSAASAGRRLTAWSVGELPADGPALKLLAGLALMSHLGLKPQRG